MTDSDIKQKLTIIEAEAKQSTSSKEWLVWDDGRITVQEGGKTRLVMKPHPELNLAPNLFPNHVPHYRGAVQVKGITEAKKLRYFVFHEMRKRQQT